jgi:5-oxoprolinase (ATP-hydrolysing)
VLGRLIPDYFPKIFGKSENEPLDTDESKRAFELLTAEINKEQERKLSLDEVVYG